MEIDIQRLVSWTLPIAIAILARIVRGWRTTQEYAIRWVTLAPTSVLEPPEDTPRTVEMTFGGQPVTHLTKFYFILHNSGTKALDATSIVQPLTWTGPGKVLDSRVVTTRPVVKLDLECSGENLVMTWQLFNQNCKALIEVLCDCPDDAGSGTIDGQIRNVSEIKSMVSSYTDKEEVRRIVRKSIARSPKSLRRFQSESLRVYLKLHSKDIGYAIGVFYSVFFALLWEPVWLSLGGAVLIILVLFWFLHNPYYALLRHRSIRRS